MVPPPFRLAVAPYPDWAFYLSGYAMYLSLVIVPVVAPLVIWALVCRRAVHRLVQGLQRRYRWLQRTRAASAQV